MLNHWLPVNGHLHFLSRSAMVSNVSPDLCAKEAGSPSAKELCEICSNNQRLQRDPVWHVFNTTYSTVCLTEVCVVCDATTVNWENNSEWNGWTWETHTHIYFPLLHYKVVITVGDRRSTCWSGGFFYKQDRQSFFQIVKGCSFFAFPIWKFSVVDYPIKDKLNERRDV